MSPMVFHISMLSYPNVSLSATFPLGFCSINNLAWIRPPPRRSRSQEPPPSFFVTTWGVLISHVLYPRATSHRDVHVFFDTLGARRENGRTPKANMLVLATCETHWSKIEPQGSTMPCNIRNGVGQGLFVSDDAIYMYPNDAIWWVQGLDKCRGSEEWYFESMGPRWHTKKKLGFWK